MAPRKRRRSSFRHFSSGEPDWIDPDLDDDDDFLDDDDVDDEDVVDDDVKAAPLPRWRPFVSRVPALAWKTQVDEIAAVMRASAAASWPPKRELHYIVAVPVTIAGGTLAIDVGCRQRAKNGTWRQVSTFRLAPPEIARLPDPVDREVLATLSGDGSVYASFGRSTRPGWPYIRYHVPSVLLASLVPLLARTGRVSLLAGASGVATPIAWDDGPSWQFRLEVTKTPASYKVTGVLARHTDVLTAANGVSRAELALRLAEVTPIPDVDLRYMAQKDNTTVPFGVIHSVILGIDLPVWNRNQGGIRAAQADVMAAVHDASRVENDLADKVAVAGRTYLSAKVKAERYRTAVLPKLDEQTQLVRKGLEKGQFDLLRLLATERSAFDSKLEYNKALADAWKAAAEISG